MNKKAGVDLEERILKYYSARRKRHSLRSESTKPRLHFTSQKPHVPIDDSLRVEEFLKCEKSIMPESEPLEMRELPRGLKVYFPRGPTAPPKLKPIAYTNEVVPDQPVKWPKRKPGEIADWVLSSMGWNKEKQVITVRKKEKYRFTARGLELAKKFQQTVNEIVKQVRHYKLDIHQMFERRVKLSKAYQYHNSRDFFVAIKEGTKQPVEEMLKDNPMLAYDHDQQNLTALHWAAKEGFQNIVKLLIQEYHSNFDSRDCYGRTPLYLAVIHERVECIYRLVIEGAKTNVMDYQRHFIKEVAPNVYIKYILEKLEEIRFIVKTRGKMPADQFKLEMQKQIRATIDPASFYF